MIKKISIGERIFDICNYIFLGLLALSCLLPMVHILALSLSDKSAVATGAVGLWPKNLTFAAYEFVGGKPDFWTAAFVTLKRVGIGVPYHLVMTILMAYPLSKSSNMFYGRSIYVGLLIIIMLFSGGLIPIYMVMKEVQIIDTIWALIIPGAVSTGNIMILMNFFRGIPKELEESAVMDGAGHWRILFKIYLPISLPSLATITLFITVGHWNSFFDGLVYMNSASNYPLQTYVYNMVQQASNVTMNIGSDVQGDNWKLMSKLTDKSVRAAQIFITALPILMIYPMLQKYYIKGLVVGSVKG